MKILIFSPYFYPHKGGLEQFNWETSTRLSRLGNQVFVISSRDNNELTEEKIENVNIIRLDTHNLLGGTFPIPKYNSHNTKLIKKIISNNTDLIITSTRFFPLSLWGLIIAKKYKIPSFHIEHGTCHPKLSNKISSFVAYVYDQTLGRIVFKIADHYIAISKAAAKFSESLGAKNVQVIYNSVDTTLFKPLNKKSNKNTKITYVGRLIEAKGVQDLINAFKQINNKNVELQIIGKGNYEKSLKEMAKNDSRIAFLGEKSKEEVIELLSQSDIFVNPSYSEGLPTSVLEAGATGLAVIATDVGGTREIISNNTNGFLIKPQDIAILNDRLTKLINSKEKRELFGKKLLINVKENFDWNENVKAIQRELNKIKLG